MCNAFNHPPGCGCGWGGVWYGSTNDDSWLFNKVPPQRQVGRQRTSRQTDLDDGHTYNSRCPICDQPVFFYQSPYGGKVFFDELGPPWPKHPCTDNEPLQREQESRQWMQEGWRSMTSVSIDEFASGVFILRGLLGGTPTQLYFASKELAVAELVRIKQGGSGKYKVTFLEYQHELKAWITWNGNVSTSPTKLHHDDALQKTVICEARSEAKRPLKIRVSNSVFLCGAKVLIHCHDCGMDILRENFAVHTSNIHGYTPLGNPREITGRLLHKDWVPRRRDVDST